MKSLLHVLGLSRRHPRYIHEVKLDKSNKDFLFLRDDTFHWR